MQNDILAAAAALSDESLLARLEVLAGHEREATVDLVAHLAVLDTRPVLYAAEGHGSLFGYCTQALRLSEDAACNRIEAARACRRFPQILELLASGALSLTSVRLLGKHLTQANHEAVLARAAHRSRREIEALVAELAPRPDAPSLIRKLPTVPVRLAAAERAADAPAGPAKPMPVIVSVPTTAALVSVPPSPLPRPVVQPLAPERYRVQFTLGQDAHDRLRRLQTLLRREIPDGDPGAIVDRALILLLAKVERQKLGTARRPRPQRPIRPGTDKDASEGPLPPRDPSRPVKRAVWTRDGGRCAFVSVDGRRCEGRAFLEFHHRVPFATRGEATADNIALYCRRHNQYEAELVFGPGRQETASGP